MSEILSLTQPRTTPNARVPEHRSFFRALLAMTLGVLGLAIATALFDVGQTALAEAPASLDPAADFPAPELPREWRWQPSGVEYEHMYRDKTSPRLDWIR